MPGRIHTIKGAVEPERLGLVLPHEHLFTDLRGPSVPGYAQGDEDAVLKLLKPHLDEASALGVTALVECSTVGVGRNLRILQRLQAIHLIRRRLPPLAV